MASRTGADAGASATGAAGVGSDLGLRFPRFRTSSLGMVSEVEEREARVGRRAAGLGSNSAGRNSSLAYVHKNSWRRALVLASFVCVCRPCDSDRKHEKKKRRPWKNTVFVSQRRGATGEQVRYNAGRSPFPLPVTRRRRHRLDPGRERKRERALEYQYDVTSRGRLEFRSRMKDSPCRFQHTSM